MLASRMSRVSISPTTQLNSRVAQMKAEGKNVIKLNVGEPDKSTFDYIKVAGIKAIADGFTKYTVGSGIPELRTAISDKLKAENGVDYPINQITVTVGGKQAVFASIMALVEEGDEVLLPIPCWVSYTDMIKLAGGTPVFVPTREEQGYTLDLNAIEKAITSRTKAIVICTPNNPTGAVYSYEELKALGELACKHNFYIIADEIYEKLVYDGAKHISVASISPQIYDRTITINGFSKAYAMTGWRIGYAAGPLEVIKAIQVIQSQTTSNTSSIGQKAALEAITGPQYDVNSMVDIFAQRRTYVCGRLAAIPGLRFVDPKGAFYVYLDVSAFIGRSVNGKTLNSSLDIAEYLLNEALVAVVPGEAFNLAGKIRISYSNSMENLEKAMDQMEAALKKVEQN